MRLSNPSAEALVRADMIAGHRRSSSMQQFIDPAVAAVAGVNPASITNGAPTAAATTNPLADLMGLINHFATNNIPVDGLTFIMSPANALSLSFRTNLDGSPLFPGVGMNGGIVPGHHVHHQQRRRDATSSRCSRADPVRRRGRRDASMPSREASLQMDSAPASPADATTVMVSLWQHNLVGLRAERFVNWKRANAERGQVPDRRGLSGAVGAPAAQEPAGRRRNGARPQGAECGCSAWRSAARATAPVLGAGRRVAAAGFRSCANPTRARGSRTPRSPVPSALANPIVYGCVTLIASDIGKLPLRLVEQDADGIWNETTSPAFSPVLRKPNRYQTIAEVRRAVDHLEADRRQHLRAEAARRARRRRRRSTCSTRRRSRRWSRPTAPSTTSSSATT